MEIEYLNFFKRFPKSLLEYIIEENLITKSEILDFKDVFEKFSYISIIEHQETFDPDFKKELKYDVYGMEDYFMASFQTCERYSANNLKYNELMRDIKNRYKYIFDKQEGYIHIHKSNFEGFITMYHDRDDIYWDSICKNKCIKFNDEIIEKYGHILFWPQLQVHPGVNWTFDLIEKKKDCLNWGIISSYPFLKWDKITIEKYKNYIIFSLGKEDWQKAFPNIVTNKNGQHFELRDFRLINNFDFKLKGSISLCDTINWSEEIINSFMDYWDWKELCSNESIRWDFNLIQKFEDKIDFKSLCSNKSVVWNYELIDKYHSKIDWAKLSCNPGLPWSLELLEKYEKDWHWVPQINNWYFDEYNKETKPSISTNPAIKWTTILIERFYSKIDFWRISLNGNLTEDAIIQFQNEFDRKEKCDFKYHKSSDSRAVEHIVKNGWENFIKNRNIVFSISIIPFLFKQKTIITYSNGNLADYGKVVDEEKRLLELFREKDFKEVQLDDIIDNEMTWGGLLFNNTFINRYLFRTVIKPLLTRKNVITYLNSLRDIINY